MQGLEEVPVTGGLAALAAIVPVARGGILTLGSAAQGTCEAWLGPFAAAAEPPNKRALAAQAQAIRLQKFCQRQATPLATQAAWTYFRVSLTRALDFDLRMCPSAALSGAVRLHSET